ncbi:MAG TPA: efflux RND transporter periplasmic adaptor subunit [Thermoanaerobaculia bacterium]
MSAKTEDPRPATPEAAPLSPATPPAESERRRRAAFFLIAGAAVLAAGFGIVTRVRARDSLRRDTEANAPPKVTVFDPQKGAPQQELILPGNTQAFTDAPIYARTSGYLKKWYVDIGARVKKGQLLAEIDSPEIDQQLQQARADLATAVANEHLAQTTAERYAELVKSDSVSKQDADNAIDTLAARRAATASAQANVHRLEQLVSFERIEAPFDGVITVRNTDIGQLVEAGSSGGSGKELFHIATTGTLRVFVSVPQTASSSTTVGLPVDVTLTEHPSAPFEGKVVRTASAIDPTTRTLLVEIDLDNRNGEILPGAAVEVHFKLAAAVPTLVVPVSALMFRSEGLRLATLGANNRAHLIPVTLGRDYGTTVEVTSGLAPGMTVIDSPPDSLVDGQQVQVVPRVGASIEETKKKKK